MAYELIGDKDACPTYVKFAITDEVDDDNTDLSDATARVYHEYPYNCQHDAGDCAYKLDIQNIQWEDWSENVDEDDVLRDYAVTMSYIDNKYVHLVIKVAVKTVDRCRKPVSVDYGTFSELVYHSNLKFTFDGNNDLLDKLWEKRTAGDQAKHYAKVSKAKWLKDNFVDYAFVEEESNTINGVNKENSKLVFDIDADNNKYEFNVAYDWAEESGVIAPKQSYKKEINTWYRQEFILDKTIEFQSPDYAFVGVEPWYIGSNGDKKYSQAAPYWFPNDQDVPFDKNLALEKFTIERVNMFGAFDLEKKAHGAAIILPDYNNGHDATCDTLAADTYTAKYADADIVNTPANKATNKEKDANYRTYDAGVLSMSIDNLYQDLAGNWHYKYTDVLRPMFEVESADYDKAHIFFNEVKDYTDYRYALAYYGSTPEVEVDGKLYVVNTNGSQFEVETNFQEGVTNSLGEDYANYNVRMHYPFKNLVTREGKEEIVIELGSSKKTYYVNVAQAFSLYDKRDVELLFQPANNDEVHPIFVKGDGQNGFAAGYNADEVYALPILLPYCNHVDEGYKSKLKIDFTCKSNQVLSRELDDAIHFYPETGILEFKYKPEMQLLEELEFNVTAFLNCSFTCGYGKDKPVVEYDKDNVYNWQVYAETTIKFQDVE